MFRATESSCRMRSCSRVTRNRRAFSMTVAPSTARLCSTCRSSPVSALARARLSK